MSNVVGQIGEVQTDIFTSQADRDVNPDAPICIGMDYNANINWICTLGAKNSLKRSFRVSITPESVNFLSILEQFCPISMKNAVFLHFFKTSPK